VSRAGFHGEIRSEPFFQAVELRDMLGQIVAQAAVYEEGAVQLIPRHEIVVVGYVLGYRVQKERVFHNVLASVLELLQPAGFLHSYHLRIEPMAIIAYGS
jgi:hypothetical protein